MSDEIPESQIPYDEIVQEALRAVVGRVLGSIAETGSVPGPSSSPSSNGRTIYEIRNCPPSVSAGDVAAF